MPFIPKKTQEKVKSGYKTIYLRQTLIDEIEKIAGDNSTSFNNVVVSMIEFIMERVIKMPDYRKMYLEMIHETEKAIQILVNVQRQCEDIYINSPGFEAEPPQQNNTDNAYPSHPVNKAKKEP